MRFPDWFGSVHFLFSSRARGLKPSRVGTRNRQHDKSAVQIVEGLEPRKMLAFEYVASYIETESPFHQAGDVATPSLDVSPQQVVLRFTPETQIDPSSLIGGITVERSGRANDPFGTTGSFQDVTVSPGAIVVDDAPNQNQVVIRFANSLPDDTYQITISGLTTLPDATGAIDQFNTGLSTTIPFRLSLGPNVVSVVPQPISRPSLEAGDPENLTLSQSANEIVVYFDGSEPMEQASVEDTNLYQLIEIDEATAAEQSSVSPTTATYTAATNSVALEFASIDDNKTFRLEIGGSGVPVAASAINEGIGGAGTSFATAQDGLGNVATPNVLPPEGVLIDGEISTNATIISTAPIVAGENEELNFPGNAGSITESGHRDIPVNLGMERHGQTLPVGPAVAIPTRFYNFRSVYGTDPQGQTLANQITETQKQRTREIFEIFSRYLGVQFVESADLATPASDTMTIATGDLRAFDTTIPTTPAGLAGQTDIDNDGAVETNVAIMDSTENWGLSEYGGFWFRTAMQQIGELLGLHHSFDLPSIMGGGLNGEAIFPGDYDLVEARQLFPNAGSDIDIYQFTLSGDGVFHAETIVNRPGDVVTSKLDTVLTLYREDPATNERVIVARNDDSFGSDSRIELDLTKANSVGDDFIYYVAVTAAGNDQFNPEIEESGSGGQSQGAYQLSLKHVDKASSTNNVTDASGTPLDGDRDGQAGGVFSFWFQTAEASTAPTNRTLYVDKIATAAWATVSTQATNTAELTVDDATGITAGMRVYGSNIPEGVTVVGAPAGNVITISESIPPTEIVAAATSLRFVTAEGTQDGSLTNPFTTVKAAIAEANSFTTDIRTIRIVGNQGNEISGLVANSSTVENPHHYYVGKDDQGNILSDGGTFIVPEGVTVMIDEGASFRMRRSIVEVGSSSPLAGDSRAGASLQVLGVPNKPVQFSSTDRQFSASAGPAPLRSRGHWGGLVFRADSDWQGDIGREVLRPFLNTVNGSIISYGGGQAVVDSQTQTFASIQVEGARPSLGFNTITTAAGAAIAATPQSFEEGNGRIGVDLRGNRLFDNSVNGVFLLIDTEFGSGTEKLDISARFNDTEVVHVLQENLFIEGGAGGFVRDGNGIESIRPSGRLQIDPGVVVKSYGGRIELERGRSQFFAEGEGYDKVVLTSFGDNRYGAGGTFDSNGNLPDTYAAGDWGGIVGNVGSDISIDNAYLAHAGGLVAIEGGFDRFNAIETHQGDLRVANTRIEFNADGNATGTRNARGGNEAATIFVRGSQPIIAGNDLRNNAGATISINSNALTDEVQADYGRQTGEVERFGQFDLNQGPLIRENRISDTLGGDSSVTSEFTIDVIFGTGLNANVETATAAAVARWEEIIIGDLSDQGAIDDFQITVQAGLLGSPDSDGTGGVLANAGPLLRRSASDPNPFLPYTAQCGVDMADTGNIQQLTEVMIHELGHALGFVSSVLDDFNYLDANTNFIGPQALAQYQKISPGAQTVPMQVGGSHWDETEFGVEIMTPSWNPNSVVSMLTVGLIDDLGYEVEYARADPYTAPNGAELFPPAAASAGSAIAGLDIRAEEVTGEKVWDDADIVHVLRDSIEVNNFHTETGLKLLSNSQSSLVVKLDSPDAGLTASGEALDIRDRIGGSVQIVGQPGYPVVLTSLADDTVGASLDINGFPVFDTNADGAATTPSAGDWRSLKFDPLSNDRNVGVFVESERAYTAGLDVNSNTNVAEYVGIIAPNNPETNLVGVPNTFESTQEKNGDDARRLGFEVHGTIAADDPTDVDVYSFYGYGGSEVWFDIDKTTDALDTQLEILDASGNVLARSFDSMNDIDIVRADSSAAIAGTLVTTTATFDLGNVNILPGTLAGVIYQGNMATQEFSVARDGTYSFTAIGNPVSEATATSSVDRATGVVTLEFNVAPTAPLELRNLSYEWARVPLDATGLAFLPNGDLGGYSLNKDAHRGADSYSSNPRDAGLRMTLPGAGGRQSQYFVRVRSQADAGTSVDTVDAGKTSGRYQLRMRLRQQDEKPGSVVTFADVRYATTGIDVTGLPNNTPLTGTAGEDKTPNETSSAAQQLGNLLAIDRNTISVAGDMSSATDVDWYQFEVDYEQIESLEGINDQLKSWATTFDIDYGSSIRGNYTISVYQDMGGGNKRLVYVGRDSNIADDLADPVQGDTDADDLTRGSAGLNDPFIGTVQLLEGTYYVAVTTNAQLPSQLNQTFVSDPLNTNIRFEPISSIDRIVEDNIDTGGYLGSSDIGNGRTIINTGDGFALEANVVPFTLADMTVFMTTTSSLLTVNPYTGQVDNNTNVYNHGNGNTVVDLDMLSDGTLLAYVGQNNNQNDVRLVSPVTGLADTQWSDGIVHVAEAANRSWWQKGNQNPTAFATGFSGISTELSTGDETVLYAAGRDAQGASASATYYIIQQGTDSWIYGADTNGNAANSTAEAGHRFGGYGKIAAEITSPTVGLQFRNDNKLNGLYGVSRDGQFYRIEQKGATPVTSASQPPPAEDVEVFDVVDFASILGGRQLGGLAKGPRNLEGGRFLNTFFAVTTQGELFCIDPFQQLEINVVNRLSDTQYQIDTPEFNGLLVGKEITFSNNQERTIESVVGDVVTVTAPMPAGGVGVAEIPFPSIVDNVFDSDNDGVADSWISNPTGTNGVTGVAFSPLDVNMWHPTEREFEAKVLEETPDHTRANYTDAYEESMHFGLERWDVNVPTYLDYPNYDGDDAGQYGVRSDSVWQRHLSAGLLGGTADNNFTYDLPGGAHGRLQTDSFSLEGYTSSDKPVLYFSYWLETQEASASDRASLGDDMRDSARVLGSADGGQTWVVLATNNSTISDVDSLGTNAELPPRLTPSANAAKADSRAGPRQHVQELFDTAEWRQSRIDLDQFAGESSVMLRFDFSTGGDLDRGGAAFISDWDTAEVTNYQNHNKSKLVPDATRQIALGSIAVRDAMSGAVTFTIDDIQGLADLGDSGVVGDYAAVPHAETFINENDTTAMGLVRVTAIDRANGTVDLTPFVNVNVTNRLSSTRYRIDTPAFDGLLVGETITFANGIQSTIATVAGNEVTVTAPILNQFGLTGAAEIPNAIFDLTTIYSDAAGENLIDFFSEGVHKDNIQSPGGVFGEFERTTSRSEDNDYRGFAIDNIIVGFAERGEALIHSTNESNVPMFTFNQERTQTDYPQQVLEGEYQLEIRRGSEFGTQDDEDLPGVPLDWVTHVRTFDTNDRMVRETAVVSHELARNSLATDAVTDTDTVSAEGSPTAPSSGLTTAGRLLQGSGNSDSLTEHSVLKWEVDLREQPSAYLEFTYRVNQSRFNPTEFSETLTSLPPTFEITNEDDLPTGDGVAISMNGGATWKRIANFTTTANGFVGQTNVESTLQVNLADVIITDVTNPDFDADFAAFGAQTVIGFFRSGANQGGIEVGDAVIRTSPLIATSGSVGDKNNEFENQQGQFIVQNTIVTDASAYGIRIDAGRVGDGTQSPDLGVAQNRAVLNNAGLVPGAVVTNTVVANAGVAGIYFGGTANTANDTNSVRPYGRLVNNTIYGGGSGIGIDVANNAAPTILNNVFSELDTGVKVDATSRLDGAGDVSTVIGTSAFYLVGTEVDGASQSLGLTLTEDPFVNKARNNFYPAPNSRIIDSSMNSLEDRPGFIVVKDAINIPDSPILAPQKDLYGLTRDDDPDVASIPGLGLNAFKDRGAVERLDLTQPEISLAVPLDQSKVSPIDLNNTLHAVELSGDAARQQEKFVLQLSDIGTGIDQISVTQNENTSLTVSGVYAQVSGNFVNLNTLTLDTVEYSGLLANATVSINNVDAGVTVTSIAGTTLTLSGPVTAVDNSVISFGFGDTTSVSTKKVVVSSATSVNAGILINGISGVATANAIAAVDSTMNTIELEQAATVVSDAEVTLTAFLVQRDGQVLEAGNDYFFQYNTNTNQVVFAAASTFTLGDYNLRVAPTIQDLGGNTLLVNDSVNGTTAFSIDLLDVPSTPSAPLGVSGDGQVTLSWSVPSTSASAPITDYIIETSNDDGTTWVVFDDGTSTSTATSATVTTHDGVALTNGMPYRFRVQGVNRVGNGEFSPQSAAITPLRLPTAPLNLAAVSGNAALDFSWVAPTDDGEDLAGTDSILDYVVEYSSDAGVTWTAHTPNPTSAPVTVTGLTGGVGYLLRVAARNARDKGPYATTGFTSTPQGVPGLVQNLTLVAGVGEVTLDWDAGTDGALGIDEYVVKFSINSAAFVDDNWNSNIAGPVTESGLSTGDTVVAEVFARNSIGDGPVATSNTVVVAGTPGVVTGLAFTEEDGAIGLSWVAPADTGGYPVTDYIIESTADGGATWVAESDISNATTATISSHDGVALVNGNSYSFRVSTKTSIATGSSTEITGGPAVPHTVPSIPVLSAPTSGDGSIGITWSAPDNGGKPISDYVVQYKFASRTEWSTFTDGTSTATSATITGVNNGVSYVVRVAAVNQKGQGPWSTESTSVVPGNAPDQITDLAATAQDGAVALTWTVPASTLTVTSHQLQYKKQSDSTWTTVTIAGSVGSTTVTGLDNGVVYNFEVVAVNAVGSSPAASVSATPFALPGAVTNFEAANAGSRVSLSWGAPSSNGGSAITDYAVQYRLASSSTWLTYTDGVSTSLSANVTGLSVGQTYVFQVAAQTSFGAGPFSQSGEITVGSTPAAPARVGAWKEGGNIHVQWDLVEMPAGVTFQYYQIQYREVGVGDWETIGTDLFNKDVFAGSNFTSGKTYEFRVAAVANTGVGAYRVNLNNVTF